MTGAPDPDALDVLCPMNLVMERTGHIRSVGPTLQKLRPGARFAGRRFLEVFEVRRPRRVESIETLRRAAGTKLHLRLRDTPATDLKGVLVDGPEPGTMIVNLSFGISVVDAVRDYALTSSDFAPTDLAVEMLFLFEAKSAAMEASRQLNKRLQGARREAEQQATTDTLTGLKNRRAMEHALERLTGQAAAFALMHVDLDHFKAVNDTLGHAAGDHVLQHVAQIMAEETRDEDTVARVGGDEFLIVIQGGRNRARLARIAERIIGRVEDPIHYQGAPCRVSASIGLALSSDYDRLDLDRMLQDVDTALYASKKAGRACATFHGPDLRADETPNARPTEPDDLPRCESAPGSLR
ncbi:GGDEF domain-containing protein [Sulfitobacter sp. D35]|uniref:GGDEF domain-containing protein n=1 Tax=Sulfitobacter sp. D35 TaxID=3083252 RepID=UPI00296E457F|nr:GGDEF domain-containing protein [Sulfitobacter sp. D35]MDW4496612.1 GGDEF domain-containing protein [Sulfitobacter sp. D35]